MKSFTNIPKNILTNLSKENYNLSINEIRMLVFLCEYANSENKDKPLKRKEIIDKVYTINGKRTIDNKTLSSILNKFKFIKTDSEYSIKINGEFTIEKNKKVIQAYGRLPSKAWEELRKSNDLILYRFLLHILYLNISNGYKYSYSYSYKQISNILGLKYRKQNKISFRNKIRDSLYNFYNLNLISDVKGGTEEFSFNLNRSLKENKIKKVLTPEVPRNIDPTGQAGVSNTEILTYPEETLSLNKESNSGSISGEDPSLNKESNSGFKPEETLSLNKESNSGFKPEETLSLNKEFNSGLKPEETLSLNKDNYFVLPEKPEFGKLMNLNTDFDFGVDFGPEDDLL